MTNSISTLRSFPQDHFHTKLNYQEFDQGQTLPTVHRTASLVYLLPVKRWRIVIYQDIEQLV
jgi:hypothetical protein